MLPIVTIQIKKNLDHYWNLTMDDGTSRFVITLSHGEMTTLKEKINKVFKN